MRSSRSPSAPRAWAKILLAIHGWRNPRAAATSSVVPPVSITAHARRTSLVRRSIAYRMYMMSWS